MNQPNQNKPKKSFRWYWILIILVILIIGGYFVGKNYLFGKKGNDTSTNNISSSEKWTIKDQVFMKDKTSTDTHKLADGTYRMYSMGEGGIVYADSKDSVTFGEAIPTGVKEEQGKMISNPSVLEISLNNWIMIYEMSPAKQPGQRKEEPGPSTQRNLYLATSADGMKFSNVSLAIDSSKNDDNFFASVPDLVKTPDGKIRLYYVCRGDSICSQISTDDGKTWTKENGFRLTNMAVDPDVLYKNGEWVMYYTILDPARNGIYKATSSDGLKWEHEAKILGPTTSGTIVDADVFEISDKKYMMFLGQTTSGDSTGGEEINLYRAESDKSIF